MYRMLNVFKLLVVKIAAVDNTDALALVSDMRDMF